MKILFTLIFVANMSLLYVIRTDDAFLREYVKNSPKAWIWRQTFGEERAAEIIRTRLVWLAIPIWGLVGWFLYNG